MVTRDGERTYETYADLLADVSAAFEVSPEDALELLTAFGSRFTRTLGHVYLFRASLTNRLNRGAEAVAILEEAVAHGLRIPERALRGSRGLASLARTPAFEAVVQASAALYANACASTSATLLVREPKGTPPTEGWPVLVVLHGNNGTPAAEEAEWISGTCDGWLVALVGSSQPAWSPGYLIWDDREQSQRDVLWAIERLAKEWPAAMSRLVLSGFSAGGLRALELGLSGAGQCTGVITVAAFLTDELVAQMPTPAGRMTDGRCFMVVGDRDTSAAHHHVLKARLEASAVVALVDVRSGLGHRYPTNMPDTLKSALAFVHTR